MGHALEIYAGKPLDQKKESKEEALDHIMGLLQTTAIVCTPRRTVYLPIILALFIFESSRLI